jgi:hypothetical protein
VIFSSETFSTTFWDISGDSETSGALPELYESDWVKRDDDELSKFL